MNYQHNLVIIILKSICNRGQNYWSNLKDSKKMVKTRTFWYPEAIFRKCSVKKAFLEIFEAYNCIRGETPTQVLSCEFCKISKNTFFYRAPRWPPQDICFWVILDHSGVLFLEGTVGATFFSRLCFKIFTILSILFF